MLDCGFGIRETERRLARLGLAPADLSAIVVTHEHHDHIAGVFKMSRRYQIPVWLTRGTFHAARQECSSVDVHFCRDGEEFAVGCLRLSPYTVPHDAREPVQYAVSDGYHKLGILTDAGQGTPHITSALNGCDALIVECNHDREMLAQSSYPLSLKARIGGAYGHLSNDGTAEILAAIDRSRLRIVIGAHLSMQNNSPEMARDALQSALDTSFTRIAIACQSNGFDWISLVQ